MSKQRRHRLQRQTPGFANRPVRNQPPSTPELQIGFGQKIDTEKSAPKQLLEAFLADYRLRNGAFGHVLPPAEMVIEFVSCEQFDGLVREAIPKASFTPKKTNQKKRSIAKGFQQHVTRQLREESDLIFEQITYKRTQGARGDELIDVGDGTLLLPPSHANTLTLEEQLDIDAQVAAIDDLIEDRATRWGGGVLAVSRISKAEEEYSFVLQHDQNTEQLYSATVDYLGSCGLTTRLLPRYDEAVLMVPFYRLFNDDGSHEPFHSASIDIQDITLPVTQVGAFSPTE